MVTDPIADMITRIRNAGAVGHPNVLVPFSKIKNEIANTLIRAGYIKSFTVTEKAEGKKSPFKFLDIVVAYKGAEGSTGKKTPKISDGCRVSKVSRRMYTGIKKLKPVRQGFGVSILSTTGGIMTDKEAKQANLGGEILLTLW